MGGSAAIPQATKMAYLNAWQKAKKTGEMPVAEQITKDITIRDILVLMEKKADDALLKGTLNAKWGKAISGLEGRKFWVIPADQTPSCDTIPDDASSEPVDVRHMARMEVPLL